VVTNAGISIVGPGLPLALAYEQHYEVPDNALFFLAGALLKAMAARLANLKRVITRLGSTMDQPTPREIHVVRLFVPARARRRLLPSWVAFKAAACYGS
jgi:hypothetical protein